MDLGFMAETFRRLLEGLPLTLNLAAASVACGAVLAMGLAAMRMSGVPWTGSLAPTSSFSAARRSSSRSS
jgi:ABC-type arginine/histidine transport system permease subunit